MTKEIYKATKSIIGALFVAIAAALYCFWAFPYRAALGYREEMQLFLTTAAYFANFAARPGGIAIYIGEFLTQFFNNFWIGAAVMSGLLILFLSLCYIINNRFASRCSTLTNFLLSIIPLIALWLFYGNPDVTLGFIVALLLPLAASCCYISTQNNFSAIENSLRIIIGTSLLYWISGPTAIIFSLLIIISESTANNTSATKKGMVAILAIITILANIFIWGLLITYPFSYQLIGIGYLLHPDLLSIGQIIVEASCIVIPLIAIALSKLNCQVGDLTIMQKKQASAGGKQVKRSVASERRFMESTRIHKIIIISLISIDALCAIVLYPISYDKAIYRLIDYDYMVRANDWEGILRYSDRHQPDLPLSVSATNLALGMTGLLDSRAFDYYQNGTEGLIPPFSKEAISSWTTGEIFFQLGLINSAQRFYFEGMEAIPNYNKSSRAVKRLAETAIIRGEYKLAEKYLRMLENTTFYRKWAQRNLDQIKDLTAIAPPLYGQLRQRMVDEDYLFSEDELDKTLGQLFIKDPSNDLARQYLILYPLLQRDLDKFVQYMGVVAESHPRYNPPLAQQALAFISMKNGQPIPQKMVSPMVEQSLRGFAQAWTSKNPELINPHRHTLYYYLISNE